jgi:transcriptional regulator with XRE-family HTH domain
MRNPHPIVARLRELRQAAGLSLQQWERIYGLKAVVLGSWERGDRQPALAQVDEVLARHGLELRAVRKGEPGEQTYTTAEMVATLQQLIARLESDSHSGIPATPGEDL